MPIFMKPGKNDIMIRSPLDKDVDMLVKNGINVDRLNY